MADLAKSDKMSKTRKIFVEKCYAKSDRKSTENWTKEHSRH